MGFSFINGLKEKTVLQIRDNAIEVYVVV